MVCPFCQNGIKPNDRYCAVCGADLGSVSGANARQGNKPPLLMIFIVLLVCVAAALAVVLVMLIKSQNGGGSQAAEYVEGTDAPAPIGQGEGDELFVGEDTAGEGEDTPGSAFSGAEQADDAGMPVTEPDQENDDTEMPMDDLERLGNWEGEYGNDVEDEAAKMYVASPVGTDLLESPDKDGNVIQKLSAGDELRWYGLREENGDDAFLYVRTADRDIGGYVQEKHAVVVYYEPVDEKNGIVDTTKQVYTYDQYSSDLKKLCDRYPDILSCRVAGRSADGRDIHEVTLGDPDARDHVFMQATIHGREYINTQLVMRLLEYYCSEYDRGFLQGLGYRELFSLCCIHLVPMANPDGVVISTQGADALRDKSLRKLVHECYERDKFDLKYEENQYGDMNWADYFKDDSFVLAESDNPTMISYEEYQRIWKANANGVDLNRNFDAGWEGVVSRSEPSYASFKGYHAASEPELQVLTELATSRDYSCFVHYHSMGQLIYYDVNGNSQENSRASTELADNYYDWIRYKPLSNQKAYSVNLGGFGDWVQLSLNRPSITIESAKKPCPVPIDEFETLWIRHRESWAHLAAMLRMK